MRLVLRVACSLLPVTALLACVRVEPQAGAEEALRVASQAAYTLPMAEGLAGLQAVIDQYPGTVYAGQASLDMGGIYIRNNLPEKALENAEQALDEYGHSYLAGQAVRRKTWLLLDMLHRPQEALDFVLEAAQEYGEQFTSIDHLWVPLYEYDGRHRTGDDAGAFDALARGALTYPQVLDSPDFFARYLPALRAKGLRDDALSGAKGAFACCAFKEAEIKEAADSLVKSWIAAGDFGKASQFLTAQSDPQAQNPLAQIPWPKITPEDKAAMLATAQGDRKTQLAILLYVGDADEALKLAQAGLSEAQDSQQIADWVERLARCLKAKDLNLVRGNALLRYAKTGEGENPLQGM
jgi:predicted RNase H-like HicB family nuclease